MVEIVKRRQRAHRLISSTTVLQLTAAAVAATAIVCCNVIVRVDLRAVLWFSRYVDMSRVFCTLGLLASSSCIACMVVCVLVPWLRVFACALACPPACLLCSFASVLVSACYQAVLAC